MQPSFSARHAPTKLGRLIHAASGGVQIALRGSGGAEPPGLLAAALGTSEGDVGLREHILLKADGHRPGTAFRTVHQQIIRFEHHDGS
jgi:hypothetical protein